MGVMGPQVQDLVPGSFFRETVRSGGWGGGERGGGVGGGEGARAREAGVAKRAECFHDFLTSVLFCFYLWTNMSRETTRLLPMII